jgi:hypothetical protein
MRHSLARFLMLGAALLLVLPPGWCCAAPSKSVTVKKPAAPPVCCCCHPVQAAEQTPESPLPPVPPIRNCCHHDAVAPAAFKAPVEIAVVFPAPDVARIGISMPATSSLVDAEALISSPPLQILHCVWRC